jgi:hypothetical protein
MLFYRYRPCSEIAIKELLYNEMYFASPEECNDPFDSKTFYEFCGDQSLWRRVIEFSIGGANGSKLPPEFLQRLSDHLCKKCPITFDQAHTQNLLKDFASGTPNENQLAIFIGLRVQSLLQVYRPSTRYFVSFSTDGNEPLMWSHYSERHRGFCLIFRSIDNCLFQSLHQNKKSISRATKNGLAHSMQFGIPDKFEFVKIDYKQEVKPLDAFLHLPVGIVGEKDKEEAQKIRLEQEALYSQKAMGWAYEREYRLILQPPPPWLFGEHFEYTKQERLFHYQPGQLAGIIYGARMELSEKNRIKELLRERQSWRSYSDGSEVTEFDFFEFDAQLSTNQRHVTNKPTGLLSYKTIEPSDQNFERLYKEWQEGWGHIRFANGSRKIKVE